MKTQKNVTISFGNPITSPVLIPVEHKATPTCINNPFMVNGECYKVTAMSFGTPHGAVIVDDVDSVDVKTIGAALGNHVLFPKGANIVFIQVIDKKSIKVRVWQREKGEVPFAREGVCVAGVAAMMLQKILSGKATVHMGGSTVTVKWDRCNGAEVTGAAELLNAEILSAAKADTGLISA